jgi:large subunit ribosomal protein L4
MATIAVFNQNHEPVGEIELDEKVFGCEYKRHLLHQVVRKQLAARRAGTHAVKHRAEVSGGGRKPYKQKGTGRARQGTTRAPQWRGGGVVFGPTPRSHDFKVNRKEMAAALRSALSKRVQDGAVVVLDDLRFDAPKTRDFKAFLGRFGIEDAVIVLGAPDDVVERSGRNIPGVRVLPPVGVNVYDVLLRSRLVMTRSAVEALTARLGGE